MAAGPGLPRAGVTETDKPPAPSPRETVPGKHDSTEKREERLRTFFLPPAWEWSSAAHSRRPPLRPTCLSHEFSAQTPENQ